jgi:hypothetical protein
MMESVIRLPASTGEALGEAVVDLATFLKGEVALDLEKCSEDQIGALVELTALTLLELGLQHADWSRWRWQREDS